jgi:ribonucleoside-diphosphate reductase beta chain
MTRKQMFQTFNTNAKSHLTSNCFFDGSPGIARYDTQRYPAIEKLIEKAVGLYWQPGEVDLTKDGPDFKRATKSEQRIIVKNLQRQILLDTVQGRAPSAIFGPICSLPEIETFIAAWVFFETIHSRTYTHILRNVYPNPSEVFDEIPTLEPIVNCARDISKYYDALHEMNVASESPSMDTGWTVFDEYDHKKALLLALLSVNALEGIRFYVSFACSWAFAELGKMEGNAKLIKLIARDENVHLAFTQQLIKILLKEDPDYKKLWDENLDEIRNIYRQAAEQEKSWAKYLFEEGSVIGLNEQLLCNYVEELTDKRMRAIGLKSLYGTSLRTKTLPWTQKWIGGADVQVAPQETESSMYIISGIKQDLNMEKLKGFVL